MTKYTDSKDVVVIGGGITGAAIARELSRYMLDVVLLEKETDVAMGTSKANSGIVHAGFDAHPGTLKAKLNVRGNELYHEMQEELDLDIDFMGSLVVAKDSDEMKTVEELYARGLENGVPEMEILSREVLLAREPNLDKGVAGALWTPTAGVICPFGAVVAFAENAVRNGVEIRTECPAENLLVENGRVLGVHTPQGDIRARFVINAAGLRADEISHLAGDDSFSIKPRKGEYVLFDRKVRDLVNTVIFPTPSKISKGILVSPTAHGNLFVGPNAQDIEDKDDVGTTAQGLEEIISGARALVPNIPVGAAITTFAGLRAAANVGDFVIRPSAIKGLIHAAGIQSPGFTAAPAIAEMVTQILQTEGLKLIAKEDFIASNPPKIRFNKLSDEEKQRAVANNPLYGKVICRCETVTEGEIIDAIHRPCGAKTVDAIKRRVRAGTGRCQGGFCGPRVTAILARELGISIPEVRKDKVHSYMFYDKLPGECEVTRNDG